MRVPVVQLVPARRRRRGRLEARAVASTRTAIAAAARVAYSPAALATAIAAAADTAPAVAATALSAAAAASTHPAAAARASDGPEGSD
jgi:hypothetical protein